ncbi:MAG: lipopolysaccharide heptosyltransferase II [Pseudomonadota bacterium]
MSSPETNQDEKPAGILVVGPAWVGDMVMSQVLYKRLRQRFPDRPIDVLLPKATLPLVSRMAEVSRGVLMDAAHGELRLSYRYGLGRRLSENGYQDAIVLPGSLKSALLPAFAGISRRTGFLGEYRYFLLNDVRFLNEKRLPRMVDRFLALADPPTADPVCAVEDYLPQLMTDTDHQAEVMARFVIPTDKPLLALCPGAEFGEAKRWPAAYFAHIAKQAVSAGHGVLILGGPGDVQIAETVVEKCGADPGVINLAGETTLLDVVDILAFCTSAVCNDSGLMHIAAAVGTPLVAIYGSTTPSFTPPLDANATVIAKEMSCRPCFKRTCPLEHMECLRGLKPDQVWPEVDRRLQVGQR